ncbi:MAG TPA: polysaccharide biosynthesis/export family protein [Candidatus Acidoferrum sp.]|nr:polysaccharide biosynthesis/export family protein [Candidatus Acidoferrum sp.]
MSTIKSTLRWGVFVLLVSGTARAQEVRIDADTAPDAQHFAAKDDVTHPIPVERNPRYRINRSDVLVISFALSPEYNQKVTVQPDGYITLQSAGSINVLGLTVPQTVDAIKRAYGKTLHEPIVDVDLFDFQKAYFIVTGQVMKPGQYDLRYDLTVTEAIALAGGFLPTAKTRVYLYHRSGSGWVEAKELKLADILHGKNVAEDVGVRSGDMIFIPEKTITKIRKYIPYGVGVGVPTYF